MAGGQIPLVGMTDEERRAARHEFLEGVLRGLHLGGRPGRRLVAPDPGTP
jgi:hypothetical protein